MFNTLLNQVLDSLTTNNIDQARVTLDQAWTLAKTKADRISAHDVANKVQAAIFDQYLGA